MTPLERPQSTEEGRNTRVPMEGSSLSEQIANDGRSRKDTTLFTILMRPT